MMRKEPTIPTLRIKALYRMLDQYENETGSLVSNADARWLTLELDENPSVALLIERIESEGRASLYPFRRWLGKQFGGKYGNATATPRR